MNKDIFRSQLESGLCLSEEERRLIISESVKRQNRDIKCAVIMEELAELTQQVSKQLRNTGDSYDLVEEMADVYICLEFLKLIFDVDPDMLQKAIDVKLKRETERIALYSKPEWDFTDNYFEAMDSRNDW